MTLLTKENFIKEKDIEISEDIWTDIISQHSMDEIADFMHKLIVEENVPFPYMKIQPAKLRDSFLALKNFDIFNLVFLKEWKNNRIEIKHPLTYKGQYAYIGVSSLGRHCSNYFLQECRMKVSIKGLPSPFDRWSSFKFRKMFKFLENRKVINQDALLACLVFHHGLASQFSTSSARALYEISQAKNILDFCGGWGDRLVGALSSSHALSYTGIDPNTTLHPKYEEIAKFYKHNKKTKFICSPAEDADLEPNQFDFIFTSPPYFDLEIYSLEDTQSSSRYKNLELWLHNFLFKVMGKCYTWLEDDGRMMLNISDYRGIFFCQRMIDHAISIGFKFEGIIGLEITQRPGSSDPLNPTETPPCEPIFVFAKGNPPDLILENQNTLF